VAVVGLFEGFVAPMASSSYAGASKVAPSTNSESSMLIQANKEVGHYVL